MLQLYCKNTQVGKAVIGMKHKKEYEKLNRIGVEKPRSYYIPFPQDKKFVYQNKIIDRKSSDRFISLDGEWWIKEHKNIET